jgi:hypothetical protein
MLPWSENIQDCLATISAMHVRVIGAINNFIYSVAGQLLDEIVRILNFEGPGQVQGDKLSKGV